MSERRVLVIDEDGEARVLVRTVVGEVGAVVIAEASNIQDGVALADAHQPDVIVLAEEMHDRRGSAAVTGFRRASPSSRIVIYTAYPKEEVAGSIADEVVEKFAPTGALLRACFPDL